MKNLAKAALVGGAIAAAGLGFAGHASADPGDMNCTSVSANCYLANLRISHVTAPGGAPELLTLGSMVCKLDPGDTKSLATAQAVHSAEPSTDAVMLVNVAQSYLCP
jgi:hypothetical protein